MTKNEFKSQIKMLIDLNEEFENNVDKLLEIGIDVTNATFYDTFDEVLDIAVKNLILDKHKQETFYWYISEYLYHLQLHNKIPCQMNALMWDENNNPICYDLDSLIDYLYES